MTHVDRIVIIMCIILELISISILIYSMHNMFK